MGLLRELDILTKTNSEHKQIQNKNSFISDRLIAYKVLVVANSQMENNFKGISLLAWKYINTLLYGIKSHACVLKIHYKNIFNL